jgi:hypothetical protein
VSGYQPPKKIAIGILLTRELLSAGGSFGTVYKAIEKSTGEIVAIKHVRSLESMICFSSSNDRLEMDLDRSRIERR